MTLSITKLRKNYGSFVALKDVDLEVGSSDFICLLGPSGCGKTTLLRIVAGLLPFDEGTITLDGVSLDSTPARDRNFGIVFQSYSLFPNMTALQNVGYGLKLRKLPADAVARQAQKFLEMVKMPHLAERYPHELSGGQQQRVAIARALAPEPSLLLLDEPLSALDARVRAEMRAEIREMQVNLGIPTIIVTHDQEEALTMADKVACMHNGTIEQIDTPTDLYHRPRTRFVADFVGISNFLPSDWVRRVLPDQMQRFSGSDPAQHELALRPEQIALTVNPQGRATVRQISFLGNVTRVVIEMEGQQIIAEMSQIGTVAVGDQVDLDIEDGAGSWVST